jgi:hypothetical protein
MVLVQVLAGVLPVKILAADSVDVGVLEYQVIVRKVIDQEIVLDESPDNNDAPEYCNVSFVVKNFPAE